MERDKVKKILGMAVPGVLAILLCILVYHVFWTQDTPCNSEEKNEDVSTITFSRKANSFKELLTLSPEKLAEIDIAEMNLLCAADLPGSANIDIDKSMATLDEWAKRVKKETQRYFYKFQQAPHEYQNSEGYFRMLMLITVLQQDFGVHYNKKRIREVDFRRAEDLFIHGLLDSKNGGTCVSMPVIYAAVARRLGYPVKLVLTTAHVFCRWDGPKERFNIEGSGEGLACKPDDYYLTWPAKISKAEADHNRYLLSLSPAEELANFLASRGHCLMDNGRPADAMGAYMAAWRLARKNPAYLAWAQDANYQARVKTAAGRTGRAPSGRRTVYRNGDPVAEADRINAINRENFRRIQGMTPTPRGSSSVVP